MTALSSIYLGKLKVKEIGSLAGFALEKTQPLVAKNALPEAMLNVLKEAVTVHGTAVGSDANPILTTKLHALDDNSDESIKIIKGTAIAASNRRQADMREAGEQVLLAFRKFGYEMQNFAIPVEIDTIEKLVEYIRSTPSLLAAVKLIGAEADLDQLESDNQATKAVWLEIQAAKANTEVSSFDATRNLRTALSKVFQYLNTMAPFEPEVEKVVVELNPIIDGFAKTLKSRATSAANEKAQNPAIG